jgi:hypothetical protein
MYADFASWQREWLQGTTLDEHFAVWKSNCATFLQRLDC